MRSHVIFIILICASLAFPACEKRSAKFRVHDKVIVKISGTRGEVILREQPFVDDLYFLKVAGKKSALDKSWLHFGDGTSPDAYQGEPD